MWRPTTIITTMITDTAMVMATITITTITARGADLGHDRVL